MWTFVFLCIMFSEEHALRAYSHVHTCLPQTKLVLCVLAFRTHINGVSGHQKLSFWKIPSTLKMFNNSVFVFYFTFRTSKNSFLETLMQTQVSSELLANVSSEFVL